MDCGTETVAACLNRSQEHYGMDTWFAGHRNGESGLENPDTADIQNFRTAHEWIQQQLESHSDDLSNDTRFWVDVPAI
ncbi:lysozyme family protein [Salinifilum ghardaiensis]